MYNKIYERRGYIIFRVKKGYIAYNTKKCFQDGHTHLREFDAAKTAIDLVIKGKIPKSTDTYYLISLIRLSEDNNYIEKIYELINTRRNKGKKQKYYNLTCKLVKRGL